MIDVEKEGQVLYDQAQKPVLLFNFNFNWLVYNIRHDLPDLHVCVAIHTQFLKTACFEKRQGSNNLLCVNAKRSMNVFYCSFCVGSKSAAGF